MKLKPNREEIVAFLKSLRENIISNFETLEPRNKQFERKAWDYANGSGGGEIGLLRGDAFEKAAVNFSAVSGDNFPMQHEASGPFFATGLSLITHMLNPKAPTVHMNIRYIEVGDNHWFGGGYDLTPMGFPYDEDSMHFHQVAEETLNAHSTKLYPKFSQQAKEYFYIPHRKKERGVGGIFFDHYRTENFTDDYAMWQSVGTRFLDAIMPIYKRRLKEDYSDLEREIQCKLRAHYVEFNLLYDRGTKFGVLSGGNPEAYLCSMPPLVKW